MARRSVRIVVLPMIAVFLTIGGYSQSPITFRVETPIVPPGTPGCVQVGLFLNNQGMNQSWALLAATLDYSADPGVLDDLPFARISSFSLMTEPGLTNPATLQLPHGTVPMTMCSSTNTLNSVILSKGMPIPFMAGGGIVMASAESVMPMTMFSGRINLMASANFNTLPMQDQLFAILTFPVTGQPGAIHLSFVTALPGNNALVDQNMMTFAANTTGGDISFQEPATAPVPTLSEWGIIAFLSGLLLSALFLLRRRSITS